MRFWLGEDVRFIESVEDQWYGPDAEYFRVQADDDNVYVLGHDQKQDEWTPNRTVPKVVPARKIHISNRRFKFTKIPILVYSTPGRITSAHAPRTVSNHMSGNAVYRPSDFPIDINSCG